MTPPPIRMSPTLLRLLLVLAVVVGGARAQTTVSFAVPDGTPAGAAVGTIAAPIGYSFQNTTAALLALSSDGTLRAGHKPLFADLVDSNPLTWYQAAFPTSGTNFIGYLILVYVMKYDPQAPAFDPSLPLNCTIFAGRDMIGALALRASPGPANYSIIGGNNDGAFALTVAPDGRTALLTTARPPPPLAAGRSAWYALTVMAQSVGGASPRLRGYAAVGVLVVSADDYQPMLLGDSVYRATAQVDIPVGVPLLRLAAVVPDAAAVAGASRLSYAMADNAVLSVDPSTGAIAARSPLNVSFRSEPYCNQSSACGGGAVKCLATCAVPVWAIIALTAAPGEQLTSSRAVIIVDLTEAPNLSPQFVSAFAPSVNVSEDAIRGASVVVLTVGDSDGEASVIAGDPSGTFGFSKLSIGNFTFCLLEVNGTLDSLATPAYWLVLAFRALSRPQQYVYRSLNVTVTPVPPRWPTFAEPRYLATVDAASDLPGTVVSTVKAEGSQSGTVLYGIEWSSSSLPLPVVGSNGSAAVLFGIHPYSGDVSLRLPLPTSIAAAAAVANSSLASAGYLVAALNVSARDWKYPNLIVYVQVLIYAVPSHGALECSRSSSSIAAAAAPPVCVLRSSYYPALHYASVPLKCGSQAATASGPAAAVATNRGSTECLVARLGYLWQSYLPSSGSSVGQARSSPTYRIASGVGGICSVAADGQVLIGRQAATSGLHYRLTVTVQAESDVASPSPSPSSVLLLASVLVLVRDYLDSPVTFDQPRGYSVTVYADALTTTPARVLQVSAYGGSDAVTYALLDGGPPASTSFSLVAGTGEILAIAPGARLADPGSSIIYHLTVVARRRTSLAFVNVTVTVVGNGALLPPPAFAGGWTATAFVPEDAAFGEVVYVATAVATAGVRDIVYSMWSGSNVSSSLFSIDNATGVVRIAAPCPGGLLAATSHALIVVATIRSPIGGAASSSLLLNVTITDVNDHNPSFEQKKYTVFVSESTAPGVLTQIRATDADRDANGRITYSLVQEVDSSSMFLILSDGYLKLLGSLDREQTAAYHLTVVATDGGTPARSATASVDVWVTDVNDNSPRFTAASYAFAVAESSGPGIIVGQVAAVDADTGRNGRVFYRLVQSAAATYFHVDPSTGAITTTARPLNRETLGIPTGVATFTVFASDEGQPPLSASTTVSVTVLDVNDHAPSFGYSVLWTSVREEAAVGTLVTVFNASDPDSGLNACISYSLVSPGNSVFAISGNSLIVSGPLDRKVRSHYVLTVVATDAGSPTALNTSAVVAVSLLGSEGDSSSSCLVFASSAPASVLVDEDAPPGYVVARLRAVDSKSTSRSAIDYQIVGDGDYGKFAIDRLAGVLYTTAWLDYESRSTYQVLVRASHPPTTASGSSRTNAVNSASSGSCTTNITVIIGDVNEAPRFANASYTVYVSEGSSGVQQLIQLSAADPDGDGNGRLIYSLASVYPETEEGAFAIDAASGSLVVTSSAAVDRERTPVYRVVVAATDQAGRVGRAVVVVVVQDANDNAPKLTGVRAAAVAAGSPAGTTITIVTASDDDGGSNGQVTFSLVRTTLSGCCSLNAASGRLSLAVALSSSAAVGNFSITVQAADRGSPPRLVQQVIDVVVLPNLGGSAGASGSAVAFARASFAASVVENSPVGSSVVAVELAAAATASSSPLPLFSAPIVIPTFYLIGVDTMASRSPTAVAPAAGGGLFSIDSSTGIVRVAGLLMCGAVCGEYNLTVLAVNRGGSGPSAAARVLVLVTVISDSPPVFETDTYAVTVREGITAGETLLTVKATDHSGSGNISYASSTKDPACPITVHSSSGAVLTVGVLDRSAIPNATCSIQLSACNAAGCKTARLRLNIQARLAFDSSGYYFTVPLDGQANLPVGRVSLLNASTANGFYNATGDEAAVTYTLATTWGQELFAVDATTGVVRLRVPLSQGSPARLYVMDLLATVSDGVRPANVTATVYISVSPDPASFDCGLINVSVPEDAAVGSAVEAALSTRPYAELGSRYAYAVVSGNELEQFGLSPVDGRITTLTALDREYVASYSLIVTAADPLDASVTATGTVIVDVLDVNDNAPIFTSPTVAGVVERAPAPQIVLTCSAYDLDAGENGTVEYILVSVVGGSATGNSPFAVNNRTGLITTTAVLDRELATAYNLTVVARDRGSPSLSTQMTIIVHVTDVNDNSPQFVAQQQTSASVAEDALPGTTVLVLSAQDPDAGLNGTVRYYIVSGDGWEDFILDGTSGVLAVGLSGLSYRRRREYAFLVQASDLGFPVSLQSPSVRIAVTVIPAASSIGYPVFVDSPFYRRLTESMTPDVCLGQLTSAQFFNNATYRLSAASSDQWPSWMLPASIATADGVAWQTIAVDARSGTLVTRQAVDRETYAQLELSSDLVSSQADSGSALANAPLTVLVVDVNDNAPMFEVPFYAARVAEDLPVGSSVLTVAATDADTPANANVSYSLTEFAGRPFTIDPLTGTLYLATPLDRETRDTFVLYAVASDNGMPPLTTAVKVVIYVDDVNDNAPAFTSSSYSGSVPTAVAAGSFLIGVTAVDPDFGANGSVSYSLLPLSVGGSVDSLLQINAFTGVVSASQSAARSAGDVLLATVQARDSGGLSCNTTIRVTFGSAATRASGSCTYAQHPLPVTITEATPVGSSVLTVVASSSSGDSSSQLIYWIAGGNAGDSFEMDVTTGVLSLKRRLDYEMFPSYTVWIGVSTAGNYSCLPTYVPCYVVVGDINDSPPRFATSLVRATVVEEVSATNQSPVAVLYASDREAGPNGTVRYRLNTTLSYATAPSVTGVTAPLAASSSPPVLPFRVDAVNGSVMTTTKLDRESTATFVLVVEAYDSGPAPLTSTAFVLVTVIDVNDNAPFFARDYTWSVSERATVGTVVGSVRATDVDTGNNSVISYSLLLDSDSVKAFAMRPTGQVVIDRMLDRELTSAYQLTVVASNVLAVPFLSKSTKINITVLDVNDNAPVFRLPSYNFSMQSEDAMALAYIGSVSATDADGPGPNSAVSYRLHVPSAVFGVDSRSGAVFARQLIAYVDGCVNRYTIYIVASDQGVPPLSSLVTTVNINVLRPPNDTSAAIQWQLSRLDGDSGSSSLLAVPTDWPTNSTVVRLRPSALGSAVIELSSTSTGNGSGIFVVGSCGDIALRQPLIGYKGVAFQIAVRAVEAATGQQLSQAALTLPIAGPNYYSPAFNTVDGYNYTVPENASVGYVIATVKATDRDVGVNGQLKFFIIDGNDLGWFDIGENDGVLRVSRMMDFAIRSSCSLVVKAEDQALLKKSAIQRIFIVIATAYPKPSFSSETYTAYLSEMSRAGTAVATVSAICRQLTLSSSPRQPAVFYAIVAQTNSAAFSIDAVTGVISSAAVLRYQDSSSYVITVVAFIPSSLAYNDTATVEIGIVGVNSYPPVFLQTSYEFPWPSASANSNGSVRVGAVTASDFDSGPGGEVEYFLIGDSNGLGFTVDLFSGIIWWSPIDGRPGAVAAAARQYAVLTVLAKNVGPLSDGRHWSSCTVEVGGVRQVFAFSSSTYNVTVADKSDAGTCVLVVRTSGIAPVKDYRFVLAEPAAVANGGHFSVDSLTGAVMTRTQLPSAAVRREYLLVVRAVDAAASQRVLATATVAVYAFARAASAAFFVPLQPRVSLIEGTPTPAFVVNLGPMTRAPATASAGASFRYSTYDPAFTVDSATGIVTTAVLAPSVQPSSSSPSVGRVELLLMLRVECVAAQGITSAMASSSSCLPTDLSVWVTVLDRNKPPATANLSVNVPFTAVGGSSPLVTPLDLVDFASLEPWYSPPSTHGTLSCSLAAPSTSSTSGSAAAATALVLSMTGCRLQLASFAALADDSNGVVSLTAAVRVQRLVDLATTTFSVTVTTAQFSDEGDERRLSARSVLVLFDHLEPQLLASQWLPVFLTQVTASMLPSGDSAASAASYPIVVVKSLASVSSSSSSLILMTTGGSGSSVTDPDALASAVSAACVVLKRATGVVCSSLPVPCSAASCAVVPAATCVNAYSVLQSSRPIGGWPAVLVAPAGDVMAACTTCSSGSDTGNCTTSVVATCEISPCKNGGSCRVAALSSGSSSAVVCDCKPPYFGLYCENSPWGFGDGSYAVFEGLAAGSNSTSLALVFATYSSSALLAYRQESEPGRAMAVQIVGGRIRLSFVADNGSVASLSVNGVVSTGTWHRITAGRTAAGSYFLELAPCAGPANCSDCTAAANSASCATATTASSTTWASSSVRSSATVASSVTVSVGGMASLDPARVPAGLLAAVAYRGCIAAIRIDAVDHSLSDGTAAKTSGLRPGCGDMGSCSRSSTSKCSPSGSGSAAEASGTCTAGIGGATCSCLGGSYLSESCASEPGTPASLAASASVSYRRTHSYQLLAVLAQSRSVSAVATAAAGRRRRSPLPAAGRVVSLQLRSTQSTGSLLQITTSGGQLLIEIVNGQASVSIGGKRLLTSAGAPVNDSAWHLLALTVSSGMLLLSVDSSTVKWPADVGKDYAMLDPLGPGVQEIVLTPSGGSLAGFVGCLKNFTIDGQFMPLANATTDQFVAIVTGDVSYSCQICDTCVSAGSCPSGDESAACPASTASIQQTASPSWVLPLAIVISIVVAFAIVIGLVLAYFKCKRRRQLAKKGAPMAAPRDSGPLSLAHSSFDNGAFDSIDSTRPQSHVDKNDFANPLAAANGHQHRGRAVERPGQHGVGARTPALAAARTVPSPACDQQEDNVVIIENSVCSGGDRRREFYDLDTASLSPSESDVVTAGYYGGYGGLGTRAAIDLADLGPTARPRPKSAAALGRRPAADYQAQQRSATPGAPLDRRTACSPPSAADWTPQPLSTTRRTPVDELQLRAAASIAAAAPRRTPVDELQRRAAAAAALTIASGGRHSRGVHVQGSDSSDPTMNEGSPAVGGRSQPASRPSAQPRGENRTPRGRALPHNLNRLSNRSISSESDDSSRTEPRDGSGHGGGLHSGDRNICVDDDSTTDDTSNDSFTASEFEADSEPKIRNDQYPGGMMFTRLQEVDDESDAADSASVVPPSWQHAGRGFGNGQQPVEVLSKYLPQSKGIEHATKTGGKIESGGSTFKWDHFFSWGPNFEKLAGVFDDIATLPSDDIVNAKLAVPAVAGRRTPSRKEDYV